MSIQAQTIARQAAHQLSENTVLQQQQAQQQQQPFENTPYLGSLNDLRQQQIAQQKVNAVMQQRMNVEQAGLSMSGMPGGPTNEVQMPSAYLQAQIMRQRQAAAAAAAANWVAQQERSVTTSNQMNNQRLGSAILRLLNFSEQLNSFSDTGNLEAWKKFVDDFYIDPALCTQSLPSTPELSYELPTPLLPAYFHQMHREIVKLNLTFHDAREYYLPPQNHVVECPKCTMCYYFQNATKVEILGRLRIVYTPGPPPQSLLKMESWEFIGYDWDEWICRMPPPPLTANGEDDPKEKKQKSSNTKNSGGESGKGKGESEAADKEKSSGDEKESDDDEHEDLFGRSPTESHHEVNSRSPSRVDQATNRGGKDGPKRQEDEKTKDPNKRARMVGESGVTARHLRFLEISDVLGQLSPLFGRKSPKETLAALLQNLPKLPAQEKEMQGKSRQQQQQQHQSQVQTQGRGQGQGKSSQSSREEQRHPPPPSSAAQKSQQVQAGKAMRQQAVQVLQKQAAQTLSQALPPADLDLRDDEERRSVPFRDDDSGDNEDICGPNSPPAPAAGSTSKAVKVEEREDNAGDSMPATIDVAGTSLDVDREGEVAAAEEHLDFAASGDFALGELDSSGTKRPIEETFRQTKKQRS